MGEGTEKKGSSFVRQAAILAGAGLLVRFFGFLYRIPLTNYLLHDKGNSMYGVGYSVYNFFFVLSSAGVPVAVSKLVSERSSVGRHDEAHKVFRVSMLFGFILGFVSMLVIFLFAEPVLTRLQFPHSVFSLMMLAPCVLIGSMMAVFRGYMQGLGTTVPTAISQLVEGVFNAVCSLLLAFVFINIASGGSADGDTVLSYGAAGATAGSTVSTLFGLGVMVFFYVVLRPRLMNNIRHSTGERRRSTTKGLMIELCKTVFPVIAGTAVLTISNVIDIAMVKSRILASGAFTDGQVEVMNGILQGKYFTITTLPVAISTALATAAIPSIAASVARKERRVVNRKINMSLRVAMMISIPAAVGIGVLADPILRMMFSNAPEGADLLQIGAVSIIFLALTQIVTGTLQGLGKVTIPMFGALLGVAVKIAVNYVLLAIPAINIKGAVVGTICCYAVAGAFDWYMLSKYTKTKPDFKGILAMPLLAAGVMGVAVFVSYNLLHYAVGSNALATLFAMAVGVAVYFVYMILLGGFKRGDIEMLPMGKKLAGALMRRGLLAE